MNALYIYDKKSLCKIKIFLFSIYLLKMEDHAGVLPFLLMLMVSNVLFHLPKSKFGILAICVNIYKALGLFLCRYLIYDYVEDYKSNLLCCSQ